MKAGMIGNGGDRQSGIALTRSAAAIAAAGFLLVGTAGCGGGEPQAPSADQSTQVGDPAKTNPQSQQGAGSDSGASGNTESGTAAPGAASANEGKAAASDGGAGTKPSNSDAAANSTAERNQPAAPTVTPGNLDQSALASACSMEGAIRIPKGGKPDPALEGAGGDLSFDGVTKADGTDAAQFSFDAGSSAQKMTPAKVGDTFVLGPHTYSVSSVCNDAAELDQIK